MDRPPRRSWSERVPRGAHCEIGLQVDSQESRSRYVDPSGRPIERLRKSRYPAATTREGLVSGVEDLPYSETSARANDRSSMNSEFFADLGQKTSVLRHSGTCPTSIGLQSRSGQEPTFEQFSIGHPSLRAELLREDCYVVVL